MACSDENQPHFKHFCKICNKGFMCGRALGGHMRAHGVGDEIWNLDDEDPTTDLESLLVWSQESEDDDDEDTGCGNDVRVGSGWSKRKRSSRVCLSENEEDIALANCLMELSNSRVDHPMEIQLVDQSGATNKEEQRRKPIFSPFFLSSFTKPTPPLDKAKGVVGATTPKGLFECKACKKVFNSHQALGGHRASHKNVKGCYASRNDQFDDNLADEYVTIHDDFKPINTYQSGHGPSTGPVPLAGRKSKVHKCSICNRIFASGQALGGHKRCHWLTSNYTSDTSTNKFNIHEHIEQLHQRALAIPKGLELNLTLPTSRTRLGLPTPPGLEVSTEINLHSWSGPYQEKGDANANENNKHQPNNKNGDQDDHIGTSTTSMENLDGKGESKVKLAKLSELKDMNNTNGSSSSWLQVGIGSTTNMDPDP